MPSEGRKRSHSKVDSSDFEQAKAGAQEPLRSLKYYKRTETEYLSVKSNDPLPPAEPQAEAATSEEDGSDSDTSDIDSSVADSSSSTSEASSSSSSSTESGGRIRNLRFLNSGTDESNSISSSSDGDGDSESDDSEGSSTPDSASDDPSSSDDSEPEDSPSPTAPRNGNQLLQQQKSLRERLAEFLPLMKASNEALLRNKGDEGTSRGFELLDAANEDEEEDGPYIEMNLGLGVLEEKRNEADGEIKTRPEAESEDEVESNGADILGNLLRKKRPTNEQAKPGIQEVE